MKVKIKGKEYEVKKIAGLPRPATNTPNLSAGVKIVYVTPLPAPQTITT